MVGAGPVGLYVACLLAASGREVVVLEQDHGDGRSHHEQTDGRTSKHETGRPAGSRSIGIHPPALEALASAGVAEALLARGCRIESARLLLGAEHVGDLSLRGCPGPYPFVLTLPQFATEEVLESRLTELQPGGLRRGRRLVGLERSGGGWALELHDGSALTARFVIGCDGRNSRVREALQVPVRGGGLDHHYLMADLPDDGSLGSDAAISLGPEGVVESFPLPGSRRRWVARFVRRPDGLSVRDLAAAVVARTGIALEPAVCRASVPASAFTAEKRLTERLVGPGWALAGDAAHVISPIGGQGMNLGLLGGKALVEALTGEPAGGGRAGGSSDEALTSRLADHDRRQRARARRCARRAGLNMLLGSEHLPRGLRWAALRSVMLPGLRPRFARYFTMRGL